MRSSWCRDCYSCLINKGIQDYYLQARPDLLWEGPRYLGAELEIDGAGECSENAQEI